MKKYLLIVVIFLLSACSTSIKSLNYPAQIELSENKLLWPPVDEAEYYELVIDNEVIIVYGNEFSIADFLDGGYTAKVRALAPNYQTSLYSPLFLFTISSELPSPFALALDQDLLTWAYPYDYDYFTVYINNEAYLSDSLSFDLGDLAKNAKYEIYLVANYKTQISPSSLILDYLPYENLYEIIEIKIDKASKKDFIYDTSDENLVINISESEFLSEELSYEDTFLIIANSYFLNKEYGKNIAIAKATKGEIIFIFNIYDSRKPKLVTGTYHKYHKDEDLIIEFYHYDKTLREVVGSRITSDDYKIQDNRVVIKEEFMQKLFAASLSRQTIILTAKFTLHNETYEVVFYINR